MVITRQSPIHETTYCLRRHVSMTCGFTNCHYSMTVAMPGHAIATFKYKHLLRGDHSFTLATGLQVRSARQFRLQQN
jgi:hypothetical protein